jgi:hypothetical protein
MVDTPFIRYFFTGFKQIHDSHVIAVAASPGLDNHIIKLVNFRGLDSRAAAIKQLEQWNAIASDSGFVCNPPLDSLSFKKIFPKIIKTRIAIGNSYRHHSGSSLVLSRYVQLPRTRKRSYRSITCIWGIFAWAG